MGATKNIYLGREFFFCLLSFPEWSDGDYGMDSTTTRCTTLGKSEENKRIEEEEEDPNDTYIKKITILVFEKEKIKM